MKIIVSLFVLLAVTAPAYSKLLCVDENPISGENCPITRKAHHFSPGEQNHAAKIKAAIKAKLDEKRPKLLKDDWWIDYCDTLIQTCKVYGEKEANSGRHHFFQVSYEFRPNNVIKIMRVKWVKSISYPD